MPKGIYKRTEKGRKNLSISHKNSIANQRHLKKLHKMNKGKHFSPATEFKKGYITWSKGKKLPQYSGKNAKHWKGGKYESGGYIFILMPKHPYCDKKRYIFEHRLVIEKYIGRYLLPKERCHHLNKIKNDNRPKNLMAFTSQSIHQCFHINPNNIKSSEIIFDGRKI